MSASRRRWKQPRATFTFLLTLDLTTLRFRRPQTADHGRLGSIEIRQAQSRFRPPDRSTFVFSSHVQPPPKRLGRRMWTSCAVDRMVGILDVNVYGPTTALLWLRGYTATERVYCSCRVIA